MSRWPSLVGICGAAGCGKDTLAGLLVEAEGYTQYRMADPLKNMLTHIGIPLSTWENHKAKETALPWLGKSPRYLAQTLGTEWGRDLVDPDLWTLLAEMFYYGCGTKVVISDIRYPNEAEWLKNMGGVLVRITRKTAHPVDNATHRSENSAIFEADVNISNNSSETGMYLQYHNLMLDRAHFLNGK